MIHLYYKEQLKLDQQLRKLAKVAVLDNVDHVLSQINELGSNKSTMQSLEGLRLNGHRASAALSKEPRELKKHAMTLKNLLVEHTCYFDRLNKVDVRSSMTQLWFYRSFMGQMFNNYCLGKNNTNVENPTRQGQYLIVFLQALFNVDRQRPPKLDQISIFALAEAYLNDATRIEVSLRNILGQHSKWNSQIEPSAVTEHLIANEGRQLPGFESSCQNKEIIVNLKSNLNTVGDMYEREKCDRNRNKNRNNALDADLICFCLWYISNSIIWCLYYRFSFVWFQQFNS